MLFYMAKKFACGDVVNGCAWTTRANTDEELFASISEHAKTVHGMTEIPDALLQKVKSKIQND
jgi:predicted small metal-binding protein